MDTNTMGGPLDGPDERLKVSLVRVGGHPGIRILDTHFPQSVRSVEATGYRIAAIASEQTLVMSGQWEIRTEVNRDEPAFSIWFVARTPSREEADDMHLVLMRVARIAVEISTNTPLLSFSVGSTLKE